MTWRIQSTICGLLGGNWTLPTSRMAPQQWGLLWGRKSCCRASEDRKTHWAPLQWWWAAAPGRRRMLLAGSAASALAGDCCLISWGIKCICSASSLWFVWRHPGLVKALELQAMKSWLQRPLRALQLAGGKSCWLARPPEFPVILSHTLAAWRAWEMIFGWTTSRISLLPCTPQQHHWWAAPTLYT